MWYGGFVDVIRGGAAVVASPCMTAAAVDRGWQLAADAYDFKVNHLFTRRSYAGNNRGCCNRASCGQRHRSKAESSRACADRQFFGRVHGRGRHGEATRARVATCTVPRCLNSLKISNSNSKSNSHFILYRLPYCCSEYLRSFAHRALPVIHILVTVSGIALLLYPFDRPYSECFDAFGRFSVLHFWQPRTDNSVAIDPVTTVTHRSTSYRQHQSTR